VAGVTWTPKLGDRVRCLPGAIGTLVNQSPQTRKMAGGELGVVVKVSATTGAADVRLDGESADETMRFAYLASKHWPKNIEPE
jgi:hypothetical protein